MKFVVTKDLSSKTKENVRYYGNLLYRQFVFALRLFELSRPPMDHVLTFMRGIILTDGRKTVSQIRRSTHERRDLSCMTRFLNASPWCPNRLTQRRISFYDRKIKRAQAKQGGHTTGRLLHR